MTLRRDFLAFTAGAVAAKTVLPVARAEVRHGGAPSHPDVDLIAVCAGHAAKIQAYNQGDGDFAALDEDPLWTAYEASRDFISNAKPRTLEGVLAKARAAKAEAVGLDGSDHPGGSMGEIWAWDLVGDLLAMKQLA